MCGRYVLAATPDAIQQEFNLAVVPTLQPRFNIAPTQAVPIITNDAPDELTLVQWGLIPSWSKDPKVGAKMINARSETAAEKPSFRAPFKYRRCLVPASGFYEWVKSEDGKQPYFIRVQDEDIFSFAGLWEIWNSPEGDEVWTCTILTTSANSTIAQLHHRMPVILDGDEREIWLDKGSDPKELQTLMRPYAEDKISFYPVSKAVSSYQNDNPSLIEPHNPPNQQSLL